jgi:carboxypeptidase Q
MRRCILAASMALAVFSSFALAGAGGDSAGTAKTADIERILSVGQEPSQVMDHLDVLCNRIGPRLTGSDNLTNACEWARDRFASFGIDNAHLEAWGEFPVGFDRGPWFGRVIEPEAKGLELMTKAWSAGTKGAVRGKAILAPTNKKELDEAKEKGTIAGAWVLMGGSAATGKASPEAEFRRSLQKELEDAKAAGLVAGASASELLVTSGNYHMSWEKLPTLPSVTVLRKQFDQITGWIKEGKPVTLEFDIRNYFKKGPIKLYNVIADIPGSEKPDEYVIVGGHIDSWDGATGATDNGTGVATTLEAARLLKKAGVQPKRTIRFMLWSGEEQGLLGSAAYVKAHKELMPKISAVLVHDGGTNFLSGIGATDAIYSDFEQVFTPVKKLDPTKYPFVVSKVTGLRGGGSDHASFLAANVPGFFWGQRGGTAKYQHTHHTQYDTYDAAIPDYQKHSAVVVAMGAYGIATLDHLLSREKMKAPGGQGAGNRRALGFQLDDLKVIEVEDGSVAQKGGLKEGDEILKVDGAKIAERIEIGRALREGGTKKVVTVRRDGKELDLTLTFDPPAEEKKANP